MKSARALILVGVFSLVPLLSASCGGSSVTEPPGAAGAAGTAGGGGAGAPPTDTCTMNADCTWGEIPNDLLRASDCPCLYGCGYLPQNVATRERRAAQYSQLCNPRKDGKGNACGIDDCAAAGVLSCVSGKCTALSAMP